MGWYEEYFKPEQRNQPYGYEKEAEEEMLAYVDAVLQYAFAAKINWEDRLEMRGLVVTPKECQAALNDRRLSIRDKDRDEKSGQKEHMEKDLFKCRKHLEHRAHTARARGNEIRLWTLTERFQLNGKERFFLFLAAAVDYDRKYERLYGYLQDNVAAKLPTLGLAESLYSLSGESDKIPFDSPLWNELLSPGLEEERGQSKLSRPLSLCREWWLYLNGAGDPYEDVLRKRRETMGRQAVYRKPAFTWEDLILEESQKDLMRQICGQVKCRKKVLEEWGFGKKMPYGNGVSAIFYGSPGTGKTMAAHVIAGELGMDLYQVDISRLVSKYIGETEKNIGELFDAASRQNALLFFDEADGLFAKRSEVGNSNDRYANMETGYLLQRFEEYGGVAVLATNYIKNIDEAFKRRIKFLVRFSFPNEDQRLLLWKKMLPREAFAEPGLKLEPFAAFELSGSGIKEVMVNAAYLAAAQGTAIGTGQIGKALSDYYLKQGKKLDLPRNGLDG